MKKLIRFGLLAATLGACKSEEGPVIPTDVISDFRTYDVGMSNDASDIYAILTVNTQNVADEFRIILAHPDQSAQVKAANFSEIAANSYFRLLDAELPYKGTLNPGLKDFSGNPLQVGQPYDLYVVLGLSGKFVLADLYSTLQLTTEHPLNGDYKGKWNDNLYTDFGISAKLSFVNGVLTGPFYYTDNFSPCCGGTNDGTITLTVDGQTITDFFYDQDLPNFMGGCPGIYSGSGLLTSPVILSVNFTGNDCEGPHTDGRILLSR